MASVADQGLSDPCKLVEALPLLLDAHQVASRMESTVGTSNLREIFQKIVADLPNKRSVNLGKHPEMMVRSPGLEIFSTQWECRNLIFLCCKPYWSQVGLQWCLLVKIILSSFDYIFQTLAE